MAKIKNISDSDNILRYARKKHLDWELDSKGNPVAIRRCFPDLFKLRDDSAFIRNHGRAESNLSVNWIEFFAGDAEGQLRQTVDDFCSARTIKKHDAFAKLNTGEFKKVCLSHSAKVRVIHDAKKSAVKSHSSITRLPQDNPLLFDDLCEMAFKSLLQAAMFIR